MILDIDELKTKFQRPLPGLNSQLRMAPAHRAEDLSGKDEALPFAKRSAVMILLFPEKELLKTVLIKRSVYEGIHSGQIAFPGGKYENTDKDLETTALRETFEEIGVEPGKIEIVGRLSDLFIPPSNFLVKPFVGYCIQRPTYNIDKKEVQSVIEIDLDDFRAENRIFEKEFSSGTSGLTVKAPYFGINNIEIWGATAMITSELLDVLKS